MCVFVFSAAQREPGDAEAQWYRTSGDVPVQAPQGVSVQQGHGREAHQYVRLVFGVSHVWALGVHLQ